MTTTTGRLGAGAALLALAGTASAHIGHGTDGLVAGLVHPFGIDHLIAMVAVGVWSVAALPRGHRWLAALTFLASMSAGAALGGVAGTGTLPWIDQGIALGVVLMGVLLVFARRLPPGLGLALIAASATLHGVAHGSELPAGAGVAPYAAGFLLTTAALHLGGLGLGLQFERSRVWAWRVAGSLCGVAGLVLLAGA